jgi:eukaryotic-like serine/threonine-protein kinase
MSNKIGRFEILSEITRSETGAVYKVSDPESGQTVALKTLQLQMLGDQAGMSVQRILQEAAGSRALGSHNIAQLFGAEEIDGQFCAAMEYVQGNSVATMLSRKEGFSIWDLQDITRQACQGLDHAHSHNVVHYSLEPAKIMVAWDGTVKLLSFGISSMGSFGWQAAGKPSDVLYYMSPEQIRGEPIDARSNLFSLGAILYEMVTDQKAFPGENADRVSEQILKQMPPPPDQLNRKLQPALSQVIMKALAKAPGARFQNGQELVNALENCKSAATSTSATKKSSEAASQPGAAPSETPPMKKSAAAGVGTVSVEATSTHSTVAPKRQADASVPAAHLSATVAEPPQKTASTFRVDPMMDQGSKAGATPVSFSDVTELPPLKEEYVASPPQTHEAVEPVPEAALRKIEPAKPKLPTRQVAKKAVSEIKKTPPKLFIYSIGGAAAVILLVITIIALRIHSDNSGEEGSSTVSTTSKPAASVLSAEPASPSTATQSAAALRAAAPEHIADETRQISVRPKYKSRKPVAPAAPVIVPGQLTVNSTPEGAEIYVDDRTDANWVTPFNMTGLMPGAHTVRVSKPGYSSETRTIEVASNSKSFLVVQLAQVSATAIVSSEPAGAAVFMDGKDTGRATPVQLSVDKPGTHTFTLKKQGYLEENTTATLQSAQTFRFSPKLKALGTTDDIKIGGKFKKLFGGGDTSGMVGVNVKTQPKGAQIAVNNRIVDKPSPVEFYLNPGTYVVDITMSGYQKVHRVIEIQKGNKVAIDETLQHE